MPDTVPDAYRVWDCALLASSLMFQAWRQRRFAAAGLGFPRLVTDAYIGGYVARGVLRSERDDGSAGSRHLNYITNARLISNSADVAGR